jgi:hypothetical protein
MNDGGSWDPPSFFNVYQLQRESMSAANQENYREIAGLIKAGKAAEALAQLDALLAANPNDITALSLTGSAQIQSHFLHMRILVSPQ